MFDVGAALAIVSLLTAYGVGVMALVQGIRRAVDPNGRLKPVIVDLIALVVSVGSALAMEYDVTAQFLALLPRFAEQNTRLVGTPGQILTGLAIWGVSMYAHEKKDQMRVKAGKLPVNTAPSA